jgi:hypothetical protein
MIDERMLDLAEFVGRVRGLSDRAIANGGGELTKAKHEPDVGGIDDEDDAFDEELLKDCRKDEVNMGTVAADDELVLGVLIPVACCGKDDGWNAVGRAAASARRRRKAMVPYLVKAGQY